MRLLSWNVQWCRGLDGQVSPQRIVSTARALAGPDGFDLLCLQEVAQGYPGLPGAPGDQPAQLAALLPGYRLFFGAAVEAFGPQGERQRFGNLIATRLPVLEVAHHRLPWPADTGVRSMPRVCTVLTVQSPTLGAVRVMNTHLEYHSPSQRMAQAQALHALHHQACAQAASPPLPGDAGTPFQSRAHTPHAVLCGDFNAPALGPEYQALQADAPPGHTGPANPLRDAWPLVHGKQPHTPTFCLFDSTWSAQPLACDWTLVSQSLAPHVRDLQVDSQTQASDHQPVLLVMG